MNARQIEDRLREAYAAAPDCPPAEAYLTSALAELPRAERKTLEEHAARCPACAAERELAREFDAPPERIDAVRADVDHIVSRLESPARPPGSAPRPEFRKPGSARTASRSSWNWGLAAAAMFAVVVIGTVATLRSPAPPLPPHTTDAVVRGSRLDVVRPVGELDAMPRTLEWVARADASSYRVQVVEVDDNVLFETTVEGTSVRLPQDVVGRMNAAVVYFWQVEAVDDRGARLARSDRMRFRVKPGTEP